MSIKVARCARVVGVALLLAMTGLLCTGSANAGGPTSVLLVSPTLEHATALYTSDPQYGELQELVGEAPAGGVAAAPEPVQTASAYVTITWLIHDVSIWRIDRVFLPVGGEPLIVTQEMWDSNGNAAGRYPGETGSEAASSHRSPDPAALIALLGQLGVITADRPPAGSEAPVVPVAVLGSAVAEEAGYVPGWWLLGGLAVGVALCALTIRFVPAARRQLIGHSDGPGGDTRDEPVQMTKLPV